jgi:hypothetical protein
MGVGGQHHSLAALPLGKRPGTHCTGGWVGLRVSLDRCGKSRPHRDSITRLSSPYQVTVPTELPWCMIYSVHLSSNIRSTGSLSCIYQKKNETIMEYYIVVSYEDGNHLHLHTRWEVSRGSL